MKVSGTLCVVPTTRPRYQITETSEITHLLDLAAQRWPGEPRSRLLLRLIATGGAALEQSHSSALSERRAAIEASSGKYADAFSADHLTDLRQDWPE